MAVDLRPQIEHVAAGRDLAREDATAALGAMMMLAGKWAGQGVFNVEEFNPDPFLDQLGQMGLPWEEEFDLDLEMD